MTQTWVAGSHGGIDCGRVVKVVGDGFVWRVWRRGRRRVSEYIGEWWVALVVMVLGIVVVVEKLVCGGM